MLTDTEVKALVTSAIRERLSARAIKGDINVYKE
jgi:hypothetical protein